MLATVSEAYGAANGSQEPARSDETLVFVLMCIFGSEIGRHLHPISHPAPGLLPDSWLSLYLIGETMSVPARYHITRLPLAGTAEGAAFHMAFFGGERGEPMLGHPGRRRRVASTARGVRGARTQKERIESHPIHFLTFCRHGDRGLCPGDVHYAGGDAGPVGPGLPRPPGRGQ